MSMLVHDPKPARKGDTHGKPTGDPPHFQSLGNVAKSVTKRAILCGYAHGVLSVETTQALIDALDLRGA